MTASNDQWDKFDWKESFKVDKSDENLNKKNA